MDFPVPLTRGLLVLRYKRFLADVTLESGETVTAHVANTGAMLGLSTPGTEVWLSPASAPERKLAWNWELCRSGEHLVGVNTGHPNRLVAEAIAAGQISALTGYASCRREVKYGKNSRIDVLLEDPHRPTCFVEVKNVHLKRGPLAEFPDAVTVRGTKHLGELSDVVAEGNRAVMLYLVQRGDCTGFRPAADIDPTYATALRKALAAGVEAFCIACQVTTSGITIDKPLPLCMDGW